MIGTLVKKELRDTLGVVALAACSFAVMITNQIGVPITFWSRPIARVTVPFVGDTFYVCFIVISSIFAVAIAIRQVAWELGQRSFGVLLLRPLRRSTIFDIKLVVGIAALQLLSAVSILAYAAWAATPGATPTPFLWSMTAPCWAFWFALPTINLGAFLAAIRPGNWFGGRLLPLAGAGYLVARALQSTFLFGYGGFVLLAIADGLLIAAIAHYRDSRDF